MSHSLSVPLSSRALTWQACLCCRYGFLDNLTLGGPTPLGARAANLTEMTRPFMEEVALNEQVNFHPEVMMPVHTSTTCSLSTSPGTLATFAADFMQGVAQNEHVYHPERIYACSQNLCSNAKREITCSSCQASGACNEVGPNWMPVKLGNLA